MIDIRKLKELVRLMVANDLSELDLRDSEEQVTLRRNSERVTMGAPPVPAAAAAPAPPSAAPPPASDGEDDPGLLKIESPMVGTFFAAANPDAEAFVSVGTSLSADTVVCLIEAMKIFNEIKAECTGTVRKILVKNGDPVEFGQPLFLVKPD